MTETGLVLTETQEGVTMPADYSFAAVNDYVHGVDRYFEELQWLALGMATEIEKLRKGEFICRKCGLRKDNNAMALAYYKAAMLKQRPPFVPATVRVLELTFGDGPFKGAGVVQGDHECQCNQWGAVAVFDRAGKPLGLRPAEFEPLTWRANEKAQNA